MDRAQRLGNGGGGVKNIKQTPQTPTDFYLQGRGSTSRIHIISERQLLAVECPRACFFAIRSLENKAFALLRITKKPIVC